MPKATSKRATEGIPTNYFVPERKLTHIILSLIHISEPTRQAEISYAVFSTPTLRIPPSVTVSTVYNCVETRIDVLNKDSTVSNGQVSDTVSSNVTVYTVPDSIGCSDTASDDPTIETDNTGSANSVFKTTLISFRATSDDPASSTLHTSDAVTTVRAISDTIPGSITSGHQDAKSDQQASYGRYTYKLFCT